MRGFVASSLRHVRPVLPVVCALLAAGAPLWAAEPSAKSPAALIDSVIAAYGGKAALAKVKAYRMEGAVTSVMRGTGALVRTFVRPNRLKITLDYPNHPETRILDGGKGWRSDGKGNMSAADGFLLTSMVADTAPGRILRSSGVLETPGMKTNFATDYSDFRTVDGILFSFREANFASNQSTGDTVITRVILNPTLTDKDFRP